MSRLSQTARAPRATDDPAQPRRSLVTHALYATRDRRSFVDVVHLPHRQAVRERYAEVPEVQAALSACSAAAAATIAVTCTGAAGRGGGGWTVTAPAEQGGVAAGVILGLTFSLLLGTEHTHDRAAVGRAAAALCEAACGQVLPGLERYAAHAPQATFRLAAPEQCTARGRALRRAGPRPRGA